MKSEDNTTKSLGHLMTHADQIIAEMNANRHPVIITHNGEPCAVIQDFESYERQHDALIMLQLFARWKHVPKSKKDEKAITPKREMAKAEPKLRKMRKAS
jgi:prevent-host-death family protein